MEKEEAPSRDDSEELSGEKNPKESLNFNHQAGFLWLPKSERESHITLSYMP